MGRVLIITEKPSACQSFATALGGRSGVFEGQEFVLTNLVGHVMELVEPSLQVDVSLRDRYKSWSLESLPWHESDFKWKKKVSSGKSNVVSNVKKLAESCDEIAMACDVDPYGEGQLLCGEVLEHLGLVGKKKLTRVYHMDETAGEIRKAFLNRKPVPDLYRDREFVMATMRERWDFLSMQFTRIATICGGGRKVLREGRLKSDMVVLVGDQLDAYHKYKKIPFYENRFRDELGNLFCNPKEPRYASKDQVKQVYHASAVMVSKEEIKHTAPPALLSLSALSSQLEPMGFSPDLVLTTYQKMYEAHVCSYPRTEDKFVSPEQFNEMLPLVDAIAGVVGVNPGVLTHRRPRKTHVKSGGAHGANRPGKKVPESLSWVESMFGACGRKIYEILGRNYLAMLCEDYEYVSQSGYVKDYPDFVGTTSIPKKPGWKAIFKDDWSNNEDNEDDTAGKGFGAQASPFVFEGFPPKPAYPTQKWLMRSLEKLDVGTGATQLATYRDITSTKAKYPLLISKRGRISMAECGSMSYILLKGSKIGDLRVTERLYAQLRGVADGKLSMKACLDELEQLVLSDIQTMQKNTLILRKEMGDSMSDGAVGASEQVERFSGVWDGHEVNPKRVWGGHRFTDVEVTKLLSGEEIEFDCKGNSGNYKVKGKLANCTYNGHSYVGFERTGLSDDSPDRFTGTWKGKSVRVKRIWGGHTFTDQEVKDLLDGKDITFECKGKNGSYEVTGCLDNCEYNGHSYVGFSKK